MYFGIILYASGVTSYLSTFVYDGTVYALADPGARVGGAWDNPAQGLVTRDFGTDQFIL